MSAIRILFLIGLASVSLVANCEALGELDQKLRNIIEKNQLDKPFKPDLEFSDTDKKVVDLGGDLFFSPDLSIDGSVSCASCHHPEKGGADGIPLPIGIGGGNSANIGQARIDAAKKLHPKNTLNGLIPRNSPTVFNAVLYTQNLFWDGRVRYVKDKQGNRIIRTGFGVSLYGTTAYEQNSLLQTQARMPITSAFEMKGSLHTEKNNHEIEQDVVSFLQTNKLWCKKFKKAYGIRKCSESITLDRITNALAKYQATLVYVNSPFESYIKGDLSAISEQQKKGALLFFTSVENGGKGCSGCHSGKIFSNENFYNLGIHPSGRGANSQGLDFGRRNVDKSYGSFTFRNPSLLNIEATAPYFHNGTALTLKQAITYHIPDRNINKDDNIIKLPRIDYEKVNSQVIDNFYAKHQETYQLLPKQISDQQKDLLVNFLKSLTDPCVIDPECINKLKREIIETKRPAPESKPKITFAKNKLRQLNLKKIQKPDLKCQFNNEAVPAGHFEFTSHDVDIGLTHKKTIGMVRTGWLMDIVNYGGVSVADVNYDCLDDIIFGAGESGLVFYTQNNEGVFEKKELQVEYKEGAISPLIMDLDGDYKYDLFVGSSGQNPAFVAFDFTSKPELMYLTGLGGPVINASLADIDADGDQDVAFAFWRSYNSLQQEHIWLGDGNGNLMPKVEQLVLRESDHDATTIEDKLLRKANETPFGAGDVTFTPNFADIDMDGDQDLLLVADFVRSQVLRNDQGDFVDITDKQVVDESNGMGVAIGDFENNGLLDWYVSSINHGKETGASGNRLYKNMGDGRFSKITEGVTIYEKAWSWGACAKDFNNDGYLDIFYVNGYGELLETARYETPQMKKSSHRYLTDLGYFSQSYPRLLLNDKKGGFVDHSKELGFDKPFDGRGISCFDYEQDGDIDIVVNPVEGSPRLYKNHLNGSKNWVSVRVVGLPKNTESTGTKIYLYTQNGKQYREVRFENNYLSRNPAQAHFGLGEQDHIEKLEIIFPAPNQKTIVLENPEINKLHIVYQ